MSSLTEREFLKLTIAPLTAGSYYSWSNNLKIVLRGKRFWKFVLERATTPKNPRVKSFSSKSKSGGRGVGEDLSD